MTKTRDMLFVTRQISEGDIERAIDKHNLHSDEKFTSRMHAHVERMKSLAS